MMKKSICSERGTTFYWINEKEESKSKCIVFCHGLTADHTLFDKQIEFWNNEFRIITWDLPLHGESKPYQNFTYNHACEELKKILDVEGIDKIILVGQSAGGYIAQAFYEQHPQMIECFVGIGTTPFGMKYYKNSELFWIKHFTKIARLYPYSYYCKVSAKGITYTEEARKSIYKTLKDLGKKGMLEATGAVYGEFLKRLNIVNFKCPVLLTYGKYDKTGLVQKYNNAWAEEEGYLLKVIEKASHNANYDNFEAFNEIMYKFITSKLIELVY